MTASLTLTVMGICMSAYDARTSESVYIYIFVYALEMYTHSFAEKVLVSVYTCVHSLSVLSNL